MILVFRTQGDNQAVKMGFEEGNGNCSPLVCDLRRVVQRHHSFNQNVCGAPESHWLHYAMARERERERQRLFTAGVCVSAFMTPCHTRL